VIAMQHILFICTGNYYRSRFAEELFNHLARERGIDWRADSCGLALHLGIFNVGPISPATAIALVKMGIPLSEPIRFPRDLRVKDLLASARVIALKEAEHRPMMVERFPGWPDRIEYWHIDDLDQLSASQALAQIEQQVRALIDQLG
jgi:low molecular weight protein-tyrosine phosphatase